MSGSERASPEPVLQKEASPAVLGGGGEENSGNALEPSNGLNYRVWGPSRTLEGNSRKSSESVSSSVRTGKGT